MIKNIIKRVVVGVLIVLCVSFIKSCKVNAQTYMIDSSNYTSHYWVNNNNQQVMVWGSQYQVGDQLTNVRPTMEIIDPSDSSCSSDFGCISGIYEGDYLVDFYIMTDGGFKVNSCSDLSHNFTAWNNTSGNWDGSIISGKCIATSKGYLDGHATLHMLYSFKITKYVQAFRFLVNHGQGFLTGSNWFRFYMGGVYDYNQSIINDFQNQALTNQIINQNQQMISGQNTLINQNNQIISGQQGIFNNITNAINYSISNAQQAHQDSVNVYNSMNDSNVDDPTNDITANSNKVATNNVISDLITLPLTLYQNILNAISGSCSPFELGSLFNYTLIMPCINLSNILGSTLYTIIDIICCGFFVYVIGRKMIDIFNNLSQLKEGDLLK